MPVVALFLGLAILVGGASACRSLFYRVWWGDPPSEVDEDFEDTLTGWFLGAVLMVCFALVAFTAYAIGATILGWVGCVG